VNTLYPYEVSHGILANPVAAEEDAELIRLEPVDMVERIMEAEVIARQVVLEAKAVEGLFLGCFLLVYFRTLGLAVHPDGAAVALKVTGQVAVPCIADLKWDVVAPTTFWIPEAGRTKAEVLFIDPVGKLKGPEAIAFREIGKHRVCVGTAHEFAFAPLNGRLQFVQDIRCADRHLFNGVPRGLEGVLCPREFLLHGVEEQLVAVADDKLLVVRREVGVVQVGVENGHVFHGHISGKWGRIHH